MRGIYNPQIDQESYKSFGMKVLQYNILAEMIGVKDGINYAQTYNFKFRAPRIIKEIQKDNADVICLVEVD